MKFTVQKKLMDDALSRLYEVSTKGVKADFKMACRITMTVKKSGIVFLATNGYMDAQYDITGDGYKVETEGVATLDAAKVRDIVRAMGQSGDVELEFEKTTKDSSTFLKVRDTSEIKKRKGPAKWTWAKMPVLSQDHGFTISLPRKGFRHAMKASILSDSLSTVAKYRAVMQYEPLYLVVCMHFLPKETRFICGDGGLFAVMIHHNESINTIVDDAGEQYLLQAEQASIISHIIKDETDVTIHYKDNHTCNMVAGNLKLTVKGIPDGPYIAYEEHAYNYGASKAVIDIDREKMKDVLRLLGSLEDESINEEGDYLSWIFDTSESNELTLTVNENKYQGETFLSVNYYKAGTSEFKSKYAHDIWVKLANAGDGDTLRFYGITSEGVAIIDPVTLVDTDEVDTKVPEFNAPKIKREDKDTQMILFFTSSWKEDGKEE